MATPEPVVISNQNDPIPTHHFVEESTAANGKSKHDKEHVGGMQDRLLQALLSQIIPSDGKAQTRSSPDAKKITTVHVTKPGFSLPVMSVNFQRLNSRIGVVFAFQAQLEKLFSWEHPTHTFSFLVIYTLVALHPALIPAVPLGILVFFIMVPAFLTRHPPPPYPTEGTLQDTLDSSTPAEIEAAWNTYAYNPEAVAPPKRIAPASNLSQDFMNNMRDLQNSMGDFANVHDLVVEQIAPLTDFSDESLASTVFLGAAGLMALAALAGDLIPYRLLAVSGGILLIGGSHPAIAPHVAALSQLKSVKEMQDTTAARFRQWVDTDIILDEPHEVREVEIFELQQRRLKVDEVDRRSTTSTDSSSGNNEPAAAPPQEQHEHRLRRSASTNTIGESVNFEPWLYSTSPYDPLSPARLGGEWPTGTQFFEDVSPPPGWTWKGGAANSRWTLDSLSGAWVEERCVTGVEVEREGGRWVYDIDYEAARESGQAVAKSGGIKSWEESDFGDRRGAWRRRRWVRLVERNGPKES